METGNRVLGVDPGTVVTGWGLVQGSKGRLSYVASGVIRVRGTRSERLHSIHDALYDLCRKLRPSMLALEKSFVARNVQTALRLGEARGAAMVAAAHAGVCVVEYSPAEIKLAVAGDGNAAKSQVLSMVARILGIDRTMSTDESDAIGAAICHLHSGRMTYTLSEQDAALLRSRSRRSRSRRMGLVR